MFTRFSLNSVRPVKKYHKSPARRPTSRLQVQDRCPGGKSEMPIPTERDATPHYPMKSFTQNSAIHTYHGIRPFRSTPEPEPCCQPQVVRTA